MHLPDGFIDAQVSVAAAVVAAGAIAWSLRGARRELTETSAPMAGMTAVFIFAAQMVNFPVGAGTSGHLIGAALAAILIGPHTAILAMTVVLGVQALVFADGGLSALGLNVLNMGVLASLVGWWTFRLVMSWGGRGARARIGSGSGARLPVAAAAAVAGFLSALAAAGGFVVEYLLGGTVPLSAATVASAMLGVHALIGVGEGVITALVVTSVAKVRPDSVYGLQRRSAVGAGAPKLTSEVAA